MPMTETLATFPLPRDRATKAGKIVLRRNPENGEFATHQTNNDGGYYWGHYFTGDKYDEAINDFLSRCVRYATNYPASYKKPYSETI